MASTRHSARSIVSVSGPLGEEFSRFLGEVRMGADHREALEAIDRRTDVDELRSFLMALVQAETFGVPIGPILRSQASRGAYRPAPTRPGESSKGARQNAIPDGLLRPPCALYHRHRSSSYPGLQPHNQMTGQYRREALAAIVRSRRPHRPRRREEAGASLVEFAIILPVFALMLFGMIQFGLAFAGWDQLRNAVQTGADRGERADHIT